MKLHAARLALSILLIGAAAPPTAFAGVDAAGDIACEAAPAPFGDARPPVSAASLDEMRGGFVLDGLNISFGIQRAVYVNGALVTTTSLNVIGLANGTASVSMSPTGAFALTQTGGGNGVAATAPSTFGSVVQNTLDGQRIQTVTVINASLNSLGMLRNLNLQSSLRRAVIDSLRR